MQCFCSVCTVKTISKMSCNPWCRLLRSLVWELILTGLEEYLNSSLYSAWWQGWIEKEWVWKQILAVYIWISFFFAQVLKAGWRFFVSFCDPHKLWETENKTVKYILVMIVAMPEWWIGFWIADTDKMTITLMSQTKPPKRQIHWQIKTQIG